VLDAEIEEGFFFREEKFKSNKNTEVSGDLKEVNFGDCPSHHKYH
jgi:hypothetical protein